MSLEYSERRDFSKTSEPKGGDHGGEGNIYVIQRHNARRLHYDLRLERDGGSQELGGAETAPNPERCEKVGGADGGSPRRVCGF